MAHAGTHGVSDDRSKLLYGLTEEEKEANLAEVMEYG